MKTKELIRKDRILEYLDNIERQVKDLRSIPIQSKDFFLKRENSIPIKAIKYSLACAIQDITRISAHIASTLSPWKVRESESEAILAHEPLKLHEGLLQLFKKSVYPLKIDFSFFHQSLPDRFH